MKKYPILALVACLALAGCAANRPASNVAAAAARQAAEVNTSLGAEYLERGQYEVALEKLRKAVRSDRRYAPAHTVLAVLYEHIGETDLAEEHYRRAVEISPENGDVNNNYGVFLCQSEREDLALKHLMKAVDDPFYQTPEVALANAGSCELQRGHLDSAEKFLRQSLEYDAEFPDALLPLASIYFRKGEYLRARAFLQRFEASGTETAESLYLGYRIETRLKDSRAAADYAGRLRQRFPDSEQLEKLQGVIEQ
jgi:type IV pilus assembly protein PilF